MIGDIVTDLFAILVSLIHRVVESSIVPMIVPHAGVGGAVEVHETVNVIPLLRASLIFLV